MAAQDAHQKVVLALVCTRRQTARALHDGVLTAAVPLLLQRLKLREAGQKKFAEWKEARRLNHAAALAASSPDTQLQAGSSNRTTPTAAGHARPTASQAIPSTLLPADLHASPSSPTTRTRTQTSYAAHATTTSTTDAAGHSLATAAASTTSTGSLRGGGYAPGDSSRDPLVDMLLAQVESLMRDKASLQQQNLALKRENEQLQELVGYLTEQQTLDQQSSGTWEAAPNDSWEEGLTWQQQQQQPYLQGGEFHDGLSESLLAGKEGEAAHTWLPHSGSGYALVNGHEGTAEVMVLGAAGDGGGKEGAAAARGREALEDEYCLVDAVP